MDCQSPYESDRIKSQSMISLLVTIHYLGHNIGFHQKDLQVAPQETEVESYVVGGIKQDVKKDTFAGFKL